MRKRFLGFMLMFITLVPAVAIGRVVDNRFIDKALYKNIYPSTLNGRVQNAATQAQIKDDIDTEIQFDAKTSQSNDRYYQVQSNNNKSQTESNTESDTGVSNTSKGNKSSSNRNVVKRKTTVRTATRNKTTASSNDSRRVVSRSSSSSNVKPTSTTQRSVSRQIVPRTSSIRANLIRSESNTSSNNQTRMSSQQCFANYKECMDRYCERQETAYNRCYCSAKLAKIDSKYQDRIDYLIQEIIKLKYTSNATDEEIKSYWDSTIGVYTNTNPWVNIDNALNIDWATTESRIRGQNAFTTGHSYCANYLRACSYMSTNLRDAYKSEIERDCATYEKGLSRIQIAAESVIESYKK